jgi:hypothetical protein
MHNPRNVTPQTMLAALFLAVIGMAIACATAPKGSVKLESSVEPSLRAGVIKSIAVLPMRNIRLSPDELREINRGMVTALQTQNPQLSILGPGEAVAKLNEANLAATYSKFLENYAQSGIPDVNALRQIGTNLQVDGILQGEVFGVNQEDGVARVNQYGRTSLNVRYTLLATSTGVTLWQATSRSEEYSENTKDSAPSLFSTMKKGQEKILTQLPKLAQ